MSAAEGGTEAAGAPPPERSVKVAAFVLPLRRGEVLLARHTYGYPGWALVGGMAMPGEPLHETARREALEETGLSLSIGRMVAFADLETLALFVFSGTSDEESARPIAQAAEIAELRWFDVPALETTAEVFEFSRVLSLGLLAGAPGPWIRRSFTWPDGSVVPVHLEASGTGRPGAAPL